MKKPATTVPASRPISHAKGRESAQAKNTARLMDRANVETPAPAVAARKDADIFMSLADGDIFSDAFRP